MPCLICKNFDPIEPADHQQMREAGLCEQHCGNKWDGITAVNYIKEHGQECGNKLQGFCRLNPEPRPVSSAHVCAQIDVPNYFFNTYWGVERRRQDDRLLDWARAQYEALLQDSWQEAHRKQLEKENKVLRRQLESVRKISASRLARLQRRQEPQQQKPETLEPFEPLEPLPQQFPRLVAAE
jgi:hypothetical protein